MTRTTDEAVIMDVFVVNQVQFAYEADFYPPLLDMVGSGKNTVFLQRLLKNFGLRFGEIALNTQSLSRNAFSFRKMTADGGTIGVSLGADGFAVNCYNPSGLNSLTETSDNLVDAIREGFENRLEKQTIKFQLHCANATETVNASQFIGRYNTFSTNTGRLVSKGMTLTFKGPGDDAQTFLVMNDSSLVKEGLYIFSETTFVGSPAAGSEILIQSVDYLMKDIFPDLGLRIDIAEKGEK